jgi:hypothetical protein
MSFFLVRFGGSLANHHPRPGVLLSGNDVVTMRVLDISCRTDRVMSSRNTPHPDIKGYPRSSSQITTGRDGLVRHGWQRWFHGIIDPAHINIEQHRPINEHVCMVTNDKEVRTTDQLYALRKQAVRLHLKGLPVMQIVAMTGLSWPAVRAAWTVMTAGEWRHLRQAPRTAEDGICAVEPGGGHATD